MATNEFLKQGVDLATQAKFSYSSPGNFTVGATLDHFRDYFGVVVVQTTSGVTVTMPTTGLDATTRHYLRHFTVRDDSSAALTLDYGYGSVRVEPGEGVFLMWAGSDWHITKAPGHQNVALQGRIEDVKTKSYMIQNGDARGSYIESVTLNADSGSATIELLVDGVDKTGSLTVTAGVETTYTFSPTVYLSTTAILELDITSCVSQEGLHYRIDTEAS
tara:strand:+ start:2632 stop:3285 length:654 start_codon:yes stop_codon:yes gene_type:complete